MNLRFNSTLMSEQTDMYPYNAFLETLLNYNQDEGETLLAPQGWVNYLNVTEPVPVEPQMTFARQMDGDTVMPLP